ncbi:coiled-coil domain-containing protein 120 [Gopherus evgoodei]|uniref:coiled-coil domain-containing protein 120 n=1 Tax=Gopherus evgoodei TaxID=1825980 RepID=UPI0011CFFE7E|nr:coiled-coil domain-containing protein 120 [Gopherus evgoodei]XP_030403173.1 coiled-coil domain-containing protein 120 [Gopherus evgoodei]XP_030403174.1 coiled-coil domain-containing protein 120 [Gopherus evgoodei]XP_030403175.1 coiled-coil domain-containing protein 120 [Gopherus evgoodei]XP_030403176.1 coiled-coil domain-containing protein 120 [Gopherus evgoodei]
MEVKGQLITSSSYSSADALGWEPGARLRLQELLERQRGLREALGLRVAELRRLCLQEAELTGKLPPEYPLEPGERPHLIRRRAVPAHRGPGAEALAWELCRELAVQRQVVEAARRLALAPELTEQQRRRRRQVQAEAAQRLRELEGQLGEMRARLGAPRGAHDEAFTSENSSLSEAASHENDDPHGFQPPKGGPSSPRSRDHLRTVSGSPDRRPGWRGPPTELGGGAASRRSSLASPTSPNRTLPRSVSSFEGRSVPATPVLTRNICSGSQNVRPDAPPATRQWSGSQDSQLGPPSRDPSADRAPPAFTARTRRSNSSEALIERGAPPEDPPFRGPPRPPYAEILLDYYLERQGWPAGDHLSRRDAPPPPGWGYPESPLPRRAGRAKSCGPPPQSQRPPAPQCPPRAVHKALALEGLRNWYLRNAGGVGGGPPPPRDRRGGPPRGWPEPHPRPETGGYLPHSLSYAGQPLQGRPFADLLYLDGPSAPSPGLGPPLDVERHPPGTLV